VLLILTTAHQVGIFALACNFAFIASLILGEINRAVLAEYAREETPVPSAITLNIARAQLLSAFAVPACLGFGIVVASGILIPAEYVGAIPVIGYLLISQVLYGVYLVPMNYICQTVGDTRWSWIASVSGALVIFGLLLATGQGVSSMAAALITVCGYAVMCVLAIGIAGWMKFGLRWSIIIGNPTWLVICCSVFAASVCSLLFSELWFVLLPASACGGAVACLLMRRLDGLNQRRTGRHHL
jgi:hypothetical protein